jgi:hypothetical protein
MNNKLQIYTILVKESRNMKAFLSILILLLVANLYPTFSSLMNSINISNSGIIVTILPLHVDGNYIKNSLGEVVVLRGMNGGHQFVDHPNGVWNPKGGGYFSGYGVWNPDAVKYNLDGMKMWGCNVVRIHTVIEWWVTDNSSYRQHIKDFITWAGERGIYVVFEPCFVRGYPNSHQYCLPYYPYMIADEYNNPPEDVTIMPNRTAFIDYWVNVANELKGYSNVLFEVYNEPHGNDTVKQEFFEMVQDWIYAVRNVGASQILIVQWGSSIWCNINYPPPKNPGNRMDWVEQYPLNDPLNNIVYSFHIYRGDIHRTVPSYLKCWTYEDMKLGLQICLVDYVLNNLSKPVICGEIGANMWWTGEELQRELAWLNNSLTIFNELGIGYLYYSWTVPAHMRHGCLSNGYPWLPPPNDAGAIFINSLA